MPLNALTDSGGLKPIYLSDKISSGVNETFNLDPALQTFMLLSSADPTVLVGYTVDPDRSDGIVYEDVEPKGWAFDVPISFLTITPTSGVVMFVGQRQWA